MLRGTLVVTFGLLNIVLAAAGCRQPPQNVGYPSATLSEVIAQPGSPIVFNADISEFNLVVPTTDASGVAGKSYYIIHYDPFTGQPLGSGRVASFVDPDAQDVRRLRTRAEGIETVADLVAEFGEPDVEWPPSGGVTQFDYYRLSDTVEMVVRREEDGRLEFLFLGKYKDHVGGDVPRSE